MPYKCGTALNYKRKMLFAATFFSGDREQRGGFVGCLGGLGHIFTALVVLRCRVAEARGKVRTMKTSLSNLGTAKIPRRKIWGIRVRYWKVAAVVALLYAVFLMTTHYVKAPGALGRYVVDIMISLVAGIAVAATFAYFEKKALARLDIDIDAAFDKNIFSPTQSTSVTLACDLDAAMERANNALAGYGAVIDKRDSVRGHIEAITTQNWRSYGERITISLLVGEQDGDVDASIRAEARIYAFRLFSNYGRSWEHVQSIATHLATGKFPTTTACNGEKVEPTANAANRPPGVLEAGAWQRLATLSILYSLILLGLQQPGKTGIVFGAFTLGLALELFAYFKFRSLVREQSRTELQETCETMLNNAWPAIFAPILLLDPRQSWTQAANISASVVFILFPLIAFNRLREQSRERAQRAGLSASREKAELERQLAEARLVALSAQIEPHFLFNTLASIQYLIRNDAEKAGEMTSDLIRYLRLALPRMKQATASLGDELDLVRAYLGIMQIRMGKRLRFEIDSPVTLREAQIPTMALITLVENAIKHGLEQQADGGMIRISAAPEVADAKKLRLEVSDTGGGFSTAASGTGIGLANIRERLQTLYGNRGELTLEANQPNGVRAILQLPLERI